MSTSKILEVSDKCFYKESKTNTWEVDLIEPVSNFIKENFKLEEITISSQYRNDNSFKYFFINLNPNNPLYANVESIKRSCMYRAKLNIYLYSGDPDRISISLNEIKVNMYEEEIEMGAANSFKVNKNSNFFKDVLSLTDEQIKYINTLFDISFETLWKK